MIKNASGQLRVKKRRIKDLPLTARPREKLGLAGKENLTDEDLIAILLGTGSAKQNALTLSALLLKRFPIQKLAQIPPQELVRFPGVGKAKASRIVAALELGSRVYAPTSLTQVVIRSTEDVVSQLRDIIEKRQEYLLVFYLNARFELIQKEIVGQGSLNHMMITAKEIFAPALMSPCASIIVAHNHPSGDPSPSDDDIAFTTRIHEAGQVMGIPMLDHVVVGKSGYFSFRDNKKGNTTKA
jgi:DNA repair protein RadC